jgi:hypothetical protein
LTTRGKERKVFYMETTQIAFIAGATTDRIVLNVTRTTDDEIIGIRQPEWKFGATPRTWKRDEIKAA